MPTSPRQHGANFNGLEPLESRQLFTAVTFPAAEGLVFQTSGPQAGANIGDFYTSDETNSTEQAHFLFVQVTQAMLDASPSGQVTITVNDAESNEGLDEENNQDEVRDNIDPTRFRLLDSTRTQVLDPGVILAPGTADDTPVQFIVDTPGNYFVEGVTGASLVYNPGDAGFNTAEANNNDDNAYTLTVSESGGLIGQFQASFQQNEIATRSLFFLVSPGTENLFLRNFDVDENASALEYIKPDGTVINGTLSGNGVFNGTAASGIPGSLNDGGDVITGLTDADAGVWEVRISDLTANNQLVFEANTGTSLADAERIIFFDQPPTVAGAFTVNGGGTQAASTNTPADHAFTIRNDFPSADVFELELSGTSPGFTAQLFRAGENVGDPAVALTDTTGDGRIDTGTLAPLETLNLILRVTPDAGTTLTDTTTVTVQSLLQARLNNTPAETQTADFTTQRACC